MVVQCPCLECGPSDRCRLSCGSQLTQRGIRVKLKIVRTAEKGGVCLPTNPKGLVCVGVCRFSYQLNANWFLPSGASLKHTLIQRIILELIENHYRDVYLPACSDGDQANYRDVISLKLVGVSFWKIQSCFAKKILSKSNDSVTHIFT